MAKVIYEFDEDEDRHEIELINNRHKLICALYDLDNYRRGLYKGSINNMTYAANGQIIGKGIEALKEINEEAKVTSYLEDEDVINEIDKILDKIRFLLD